MRNKQPKKKLAARVWDALFPSNQTHKRLYAGASVSRLNAGWTTQPTGANWERRVSLTALIARSREAARDYLHIVNYLRLMRSNVISEHGIQLQSRAMQPDGKTLNIELNKRIQNAFEEWGHAETCTMSGKLDWKGVQDLAVTQCERDGAFLIQMVEANNEWGFALKMWDISWLDLTYNVWRQDGSNRIIMSVEVDDNYKPVAYWMTRPLSELNFTPQVEGKRVRIPADQIIHGLQVLDDESQVHGVPGIAAALLPAKNTYSYSESVVMASRVAANQFGVLKNTVPDGLEPAFDGREDSDGNLQHPFIDSSPLSITPLLPNWELQQFKPEQPTQNHPAFKESLDMDVAVALGVPYFLLMGNWTAVNFSSSRGGLGEFRERCTRYQSFISRTLCRPVFHAWLRAAYLNGKVNITAKQYAELQNPTWHARGWPYIDPTKDINADIMTLANNASSLTRVLADQGIDIADIFEEIQSERELAATYGIELKYVTAIRVADTGTAPEADSGPPPADTAPPPTAKPKREFTNGHAEILN